MSFPKKKLLVILGAGSSISCGIPSVPMIENKMKELGQAWKAQICNGPGGAVSDIFNELWDIIEGCYGNHSQHHGSPVNFEKVSRRDDGSG